MEFNTTDRRLLFATTSILSQRSNKLLNEWLSGAPSPKIKPEHEADHSPTTCAGVKKAWSFILQQVRDSFIFIFTKHKFWSN
jgi:hypothetical protein